MVGPPSRSGSFEAGVVSCLSLSKRGQRSSREVFILVLFSLVIAMGRYSLGQAFTVHYHDSMRRGHRQPHFIEREPGIRGGEDSPNFMPLDRDGADIRAGPCRVQGPGSRRLGSAVARAWEPLCFAQCRRTPVCLPEACENNFTFSLESFLHFCLKR